MGEGRDERDGRERREEEREKEGKGGRGMGSRDQGVIGTSVKVHHRGQSAPQGSKCN